MAPSDTLLRLGDRKALKVLHRVSTNALLDLKRNEARATLFCDGEGRLLHRAVIGRDGNGTVWVLRPDTPAEELVAHVRAQAPGGEIQIHDEGADAVVFLAPAVARIEWGGAFGHAAGMMQARLVHGEQVCMVRRGSGEPLSEQSRAAFTARTTPRRILLGLPRHGQEIVTEFNPFEVGLHHEVDFGKRDFPGRRPLLRLLEAGGLKRQLVRLEGDGSPPPVPGDVVTSGKPAGRLTSTAPLAEGGWIGLAVLRDEAIRTPGRLQVAGGGHAWLAEVFPVEACHCLRFWRGLLT